MVEHDAVARVDAVTLPVVDGDVVGVDLGHAVGASGSEAGGFGLGSLGRVAEHFRTGGLVETNARVHQLDGLQHPGDPQARDVARVDGLGPTGGDETLSRQVVDLLGTDFGQQVGERMLVQEVGLVEGDAVLDVVDALKVGGGGPAHHPVDLVALLQKELGQVRAVLAGDAGDQSTRRTHGSASSRSGSHRQRGLNEHPPYTRRIRLGQWERCSEGAAEPRFVIDSVGSDLVSCHCAGHSPEQFQSVCNPYGQGEG